MHVFGSFHTCTNDTQFYTDILLTKPSNEHGFYHLRGPNYLSVLRTHGEYDGVLLDLSGTGAIRASAMQSACIALRGADNLEQPAHPFEASGSILVRLNPQQRRAHVSGSILNPLESRAGIPAHP